MFRCTCVVCVLSISVNLFACVYMLTCVRMCLFVCVHACFYK